MRSTAFWELVSDTRTFHHRAINNRYGGYHSPDRMFKRNMAAIEQSYVNEVGSRGILWMYCSNASQLT